MTEKTLFCPHHGAPCKDGTTAPYQVCALYDIENARCGLLTFHKQTEKTLKEIRDKDSQVKVVPVTPAPTKKGFWARVFGGS